MIRKEAKMPKTEADIILLKQWDSVRASVWDSIAAHKQRSCGRKNDLA
jgi:hypothetical protein